MCYAAYIGTNTRQATESFIPDQTYIYLENPTQDGELTGLKPKFSKTFIYYVGSYQNCSCGFAYDPTGQDTQKSLDDNEDMLKATKSISALISLLDNLTKQEDVEFYCCWQGDWEDPVEYEDRIDIRQIVLGQNYFGLTENRFILFKKQA